VRGLRPRKHRIAFPPLRDIRPEGDQTPLSTGLAGSLLLNFQRFLSSESAGI